jgi:hypothetical protein
MLMPTFSKSNRDRHREGLPSLGESLLNMSGDGGDAVATVLPLRMPMPFQL